MTAESPKLGLLAGGGRLPSRIVEHCRATGRPVFVIALEGQADSHIGDGVEHAWVRLGAGGTILHILRREAVAEVVMAGAVRRPAVGDLVPDLTTAGFLARSGAAALGDDGLLRAVIRELEDRHGLRVVGINDVLPDTVAEAGLLAGPEPDAGALSDIARGRVVARGIGGLDVGQGAVVQQGIVLAAEAAEGTDAMIGRAGGLARSGPGGVLVKVSKPGQESRADLPAIGPATVRAAQAAGLRGIAVEAGAVLIVDKAETFTVADRAGIFVLGLAAEDTPE